MDPDELLKLFHEKVSEVYGDVDFETLEKKLIGLKVNGQPLNHEHLLIIEQAQWPFKKYWMWPLPEQISDQLTEGSIKLSGLVNKERKIITKLFDIFKNIALVSIILRFVWPEYYGIYSPPPLKLLRVERGDNEVEDYLNYIYKLRLFKSSFNSNPTTGSEISTAQVDMIILGVFYKSIQNEEFKKKFISSFGVELSKDLAPVDLIKYLLDNPLQIAKSFLENGDYLTAGMWASQVLENVLKKHGTLSFMQLEEKKKQKRASGLWMHKVALWNIHKSDLKKYDITEYDLDNLISLRNNAMHEIKKLSRADAELMISKLEILDHIIKNIY